MRFLITSRITLTPSIPWPAERTITRSQPNLDIKPAAGTKGKVWAPGARVPHVSPSLNCLLFTRLSQQKFYLLSAKTPSFL